MNYLLSFFKIMTYFFLGGVSQLAFSVSPCESKSNLAELTGHVITVQSELELQTALSNLQDSTTLLLDAGSYNLSNTLYIKNNNITLRGGGNSCADVVLLGNGMDNAEYGDVPHGIWSNAENLKIENLTIKDIYFHGIILNAGAQSPTINRVQIFDTGEQLIKVNPTRYGVGVNNGVVMNSMFAYTNGTPKTNRGSGIGYTNGIDIHAGKNWQINGNRFENFHTPDSSSWWWNPVVLLWNGAENSLVENNVFIDVDRAIAFGLTEREEGNDHSGGIIRNNMIYLSDGLMSDIRTNNSDASILVWSSPNTTVAHNTVFTNGNINQSIEFRFNTSGARAINNLADKVIGSRNSGEYTQSGNYFLANSNMFENAITGDLRLVSSALDVIDKVNVSEFASLDFYNRERLGAGLVDVGAHEIYSLARPSSPVNVILNKN